MSYRLILRFCCLGFGLGGTLGWSQSPGHQAETGNSHATELMESRKNKVNSQNKEVPKTDIDFVCDTEFQIHLAKALAWTRLYVRMNNASEVMNSRQEEALNKWIGSYLSKKYGNIFNEACPAKVTQRQSGNSYLDEFNVEFTFKKHPKDKKVSLNPCLPAFRLTLSGTDSKRAKENSLSIRRVEERRKNTPSLRRVCRLGIFGSRPEGLKPILLNTSTMGPDEQFQFYENLRTQVGANW